MEARKTASSCMDEQYAGGPNGSPDACILVRRASRAVTHLYDLVLAPTGLKATQFVLLRAIEQHGEIPSPAWPRNTPCRRRLSPAGWRACAEPG